MDKRIVVFYKYAYYTFFKSRFLLASRHIIYYALVATLGSSA